ncbi:MAG TPA: C45 family peptidase, partial [Chitinophagales bacterium]
MIFALFIAVLLYQASNVPLPKIENEKVFTLEVKKENTRTTCGKSFAQENKFGIYEIYGEGAAFERGYTMGKAMQELKLRHETNFVESINALVPSPKYLQFLKVIVGILNRNLYKYFQPEFLEELYGLSFSSPSTFNYIAPPYQRVLNYHAAHDIGHALQNFGLVGCSSFVTRNARTENNALLLARNLDFSPSESFNELKALYFINPEKGNKYVSYSWPGFIGVVSGMNEHGLCVVVHAAKSKMRFSIGTPVSIVAREIMQYAHDLPLAREILKKRKTFVSELFLVVSAKDNSAVVFEKEPESLTEYEMQDSQLICTNHLLSEARKNEAENLEWKETISSAYREKRLKELLSKQEKINPQNAVEILRDIHGLNDSTIGLQNENAINQLAAHHGIIFNATAKEFWVSANPFMLGEIVAYNFDEAFLKAQQQTVSSLHNEEKSIAKSTW